MCSEGNISIDLPSLCRVEKKVQVGSKEAKEFFESQSSTQSTEESGNQRSALLTG